MKKILQKLKRILRQTQKKTVNKKRMQKCVCVCVRERERERGTEGKRSRKIERV